jgi:hypothetical protein
MLMSSTFSGSRVAWAGAGAEATGAALLALGPDGAETLAGGVECCF